jgi:hypothetical protein
MTFTCFAISPIPTCIRTQRRQRGSAFNGCTTCGMVRRTQSPTDRIVVRPHLNQDLIEILARDIESACEYLEQHGGTATPPRLHEAHKTSAKC